ncbi:MAG: OmpA family protein [Pseudomonadota bacterium]
MARSIVVMCALVAMPSFGVAEEMTDAELAALFESQRDAIAAVEKGEADAPLGQSRGLAAAVDLGATRGLKLVAVESDETASQERGVVVTSSASAMEATTEAAAATDAVATTEPAVATADEGTASVTYASFAPEYQINVRVTFDLDSAALREEEKPRLEQLCRVMRSSDVEKFRVVGHTDATGSEEYNQRLSRLRAEEVQRFFVEECGITAERIEAIGVGERFPFVADDPEAGENRRVEFQALS